MAEAAGLSAARLREIAARCAAATPGPWTWQDGALVGGTDDTVVLWPNAERAIRGTRADLAFAEHARADVPALLAEVRRLRAGLVRVREMAGSHTVTKPYPPCGFGEIYETANAALDGAA